MMVDLESCQQSVLLLDNSGIISRYHYYDIEAIDLPIIINEQLSLQSNKTDSNGTCDKRSSVHIVWGQ